MFNVVNKLLDSDTHQCARHRILAVGDDPETCAKLLGVLTSVHDYKAIVVDVDKTTPTPDTVSLEAVLECSKTYSDVISIPKDCIVAETRQRSWFRGHAWDFFTSYNKVYSDTKSDDITTLYNVDVVIYVLGTRKQSVKASSSMESFFNANKATTAFKVLIIDVEDSVHNCKSTECSRICKGVHIDCLAPHIAVFKVKLNNMDASTKVIKQIMKNVMQQSPIFCD